MLGRRPVPASRRINGSGFRSLACLLCALPAAVAAEPAASIVQLAREVRSAAFPDLAGVRISYRSFHSSADFFQSRPGIRGYTVLINDSPVLLTAPADGLRAILGHEFEHICWYRARPRWKLIGLLRLMRTSSDAKWERETDLRTLSRGYGPGLRQYRLWLYAHIPARAAERKKMLYMTPDEIAAALRDKAK
jgi:hypothetical protein